MSEASDKQAIRLHGLMAESAQPSENVLDLLEDIARGSGAHKTRDRPHLDGADIADHLESLQYPRNISRKYSGQILVYSCASPAVVAILQTLSDMFG